MIAARGSIAVHALPGTLKQMIGYLEGMARKGGIVVDASGVGWKVATAHPLPAGTQVELLVTTVVREDAILLYGFPDEVSQELFVELTRVSGVGPSIAMAVLAGMTPGQLATAVAGKDAKAVASVKGVGAKVAERIVTLVRIPAGIELEGPPISVDSTSAGHDDLVAALVSLGWDGASARKAIAAARLQCDTDEDVLRTALRHRA